MTRTSTASTGSRATFQHSSITTSITYGAKGVLAISDWQRRIVLRTTSMFFPAVTMRQQIILLIGRMSSRSDGNR